MQQRSLLQFGPSMSLEWNKSLKKKVLDIENDEPVFPLYWLIHVFSSSWQTKNSFWEDQISCKFSIKYNRLPEFQLFYARGNQKPLREMLIWGTYCSAQQRPDKNTVLILYTNIQNRINNYSIHALTNTQRKLGKYLDNMQIKLIPQNGFVLNSFYLHT